MMQKGFNDYKLYVFDLDGTLYDQPRLRKIMAMRLIKYYILHPFSMTDLLILMYFRKVKDSWTESAADDDIIKKVSEDKHTGRDRVARIVRKWIYDDPLFVLRKTRDEALIKRISLLRSDGAKVVVLSDYPTAAKLKALGVSVDGSYGPEDARIDELKPSPKGLWVIMEDFDVAAEDVLMIGDRMEKDGASAEAAGVDFLILDRHVSRRDLDEI